MFLLAYFVISLITARLYYTYYPWAITEERCAVDERYVFRQKISYSVTTGHDGLGLINSRVWKYVSAAPYRVGTSMIASLFWPIILVFGLVAFKNEPKALRDMRNKDKQDDQDRRIALLEKELSINGQAI